MNIIMYMIKDDLEIILVTYNRKPYLKRTLEQLFSESSPVKDFQITILDNHSDDGSAELIDEYCTNFPNLKHITHNRNIGGNANIARAFEIAKKKYVWVICDDDYYEWGNWHYVEDAIENQDHDCIVVARNQIRNEHSISDIMFQLTFLPSAIYKTATVDTTVMRNIYDNIHNMSPHFAVGANIANTTKDFYVIPKDVVINGASKDSADGKKTADMSYTRDNDTKRLSPEARNMHFFIGYVNSLILLNDKNAVMNGLRSAVAYKPFCQNLTGIFVRVVQKSYKDKRCSNFYYDVACRVDFISKCLLTIIKYSPIFLYVAPKGIHLLLLGRLNIRLIPFKL